MLGLGASFFLTALLYACVGFGGGSTYNALLVLGGTDYRIIPTLSLICNIIVVSGGAWHFYRAKYLNIKLLVPWLATSIPASFIGGLIPMPERIFTGLLGIILFLAGLYLIVSVFLKRFRQQIRSFKPYSFFNAASLGGILGLLAGITGIGGGIFLAPILHFSRWGSEKQIAGGCAFFILVNSIAGLIGQFLKLDVQEIGPILLPYWILLPAVLVGGQIGSWLGSTKIHPNIIRVGTGVLILYVAFRLMRKFMQY